MKLMFYFSGENVELAKEEALAVLKPKDYKLYGRMLIATGKTFKFDRLAFTHKVLKLVFISNKKSLRKDISKVNWQRNYKENFCVRSHFNQDEKDLASLIWEKLKDPKVKLKNSSTQIEFFEEKGKIFCGILLKDVEKGYKARRPHLRPGFHPSSMDPKLARACVNLSGIKEKQTLYDPFCGTGGILIEGGFIGCKVIGSDIDTRMLARAEKNFKEYGIKKYRLFKEDATKTKQKCDAIVTDPPYGKSSSKYKEDNLYEDFLDNAYDIMKKNSRLIFVLPTRIKFKTKFKIVNKIDHYIHHTMTRRIYVMVR